jgi:hypothetical protein
MMSLIRGLQRNDIMTRLRLPLFIAASLFQTSLALAQSPDDNTRTIPTELRCGALSSQPNKRGPFVAQINLSFAKGALSGERKLISFPGKETFHGTIDPIGRIKLSGDYSDRGAWTYTFVGQLSDKKSTVLNGGLEVTNGMAGYRRCTLALLPKPSDLMELFSAE